jgi:hypothetical protein
MPNLLKSINKINKAAISNENYKNTCKRNFWQ